MIPLSFAVYLPTPICRCLAGSLVCFSKKHWIFHWNTYSWKRSEGSTLFNSSPGFSQIILALPFHLPFYLGFEKFKFLKTQPSPLFVSFIHVVSLSLIHQTIKYLLSAYHVLVNEGKISIFLEFYNLLWWHKDKKVNDNSHKEVIGMR